MNPRDLLPLTPKDTTCYYASVSKIGSGAQTHVITLHRRQALHQLSHLPSPVLMALLFRPEPIIHSLVLSLGIWTPRAVLSSGHCSSALPNPHRSHCWPVMKEVWSTKTALCNSQERVHVRSWETSPGPSPAPDSRSYLMMLEASSASGSAQYLLARIRQASADSIWETKRKNRNKHKHINRYTQLQSLCVDSI